MLEFLQFDFLFCKPSCVMGKNGRNLIYQFHFGVSHSEVLHQSDPVLDDLIPSSKDMSDQKRLSVYKLLHTWILRAVRRSIAVLNRRYDHTINTSIIIIIIILTCNLSLHWKPLYTTLDTSYPIALLRSLNCG